MCTGFGAKIRIFLTGNCYTHQVARLLPSFPFSFGVFGNQLGVALGFLIPPLIIAGPIESFRGVANPSEEVNGTDTIYDGTFPDDWRNETHWSGVTEAATSEVTNQIRLLFFTFAGICVFLLLLVVLLFQDKPPKPANRASIRR